MGMFDWIGEAIGGAASALAEFMGDAGNHVIRGIFTGATSLGNDVLKLVLSELGGSETEIKLTASSILGDVDKRVFTDTKDIIDAALAVKGEVSPDEAAKALDGLWNTNKIGLQQAMLDGMIAEAVSLGQFEGLYQYLDIYNKALGLLEINSKISMMKYETAWITSYQRHLNRTYPNKIAGSSDLVNFQLREVWDKERRPELLKEDATGIYYDYMLESGFTRERAADYWAAHWVLPSIGSLNEMLHRRVITPEEWDRFVKYNDFDPIVRPWLKAISYKPYTRVDTRRMWDLGLLSDTEVLNNYMDLGYDEEHATRMTIWTKAYVLSVELRARYSKGWITADQVLDEIVAAGVPKKRAEVWVQKIVKPEKEGRTTVERDLTKAEIVKGVKEGILEPSDAIQMLMGLGYDDSEAEYILTVNLAVITGSPKNKKEFWELVNLRRKAQGLPEIKEPTESKKAKKGNGENERTLSPKK